MFSLSSILKKVREAKDLSQKELAGRIDMAQAQYSRIENGKNDPSFSVVVKIAEALDLSLSDFFRADEIFNKVDSQSKTLLEKLNLLDSLDDIEKQSMYNLIDSLVAKKKLKDNLTNLINS